MTKDEQDAMIRAFITGVIECRSDLTMHHDRECETEAYDTERDLARTILKLDSDTDGNDD